MKNYFKFWGTRGSCPVSGLEYSHFGGNTCCLELRYDDTFIIIDAGTGIRPLGLHLQNEKKIDLFLSHMHLDHVIAFPFFEPNYHKNVKITIWAPQGEGRSSHQLFQDLMSSEFFPIHLEQMHAKLEFKTIHEKKPIQLGPFTIDFHRTHHPGMTYCFKIKTPRETIGYVTDNEVSLANESSFIEFHKNCDYLIHEAQYSPEEYAHKANWGHSSLARAIKLVEEIRPLRWLVTHHDPEHTDTDLKALEKIARSQTSCPVEWVADGQSFPLK